MNSFKIKEQEWIQLELKDDDFDHPTVPFKDAKEFVETLKREGFDVTFEVYEGAGHGNYDPSTAIMNWLMHYGL